MAKREVKAVVCAAMSEIELVALDTLGKELGTLDRADTIRYLVSRAFMRSTMAKIELEGPLV